MVRRTDPNADDPVSVIIRIIGGLIVLALLFFTGWYVVQHGDQLTGDAIVMPPELAETDAVTALQAESVELEDAYDELVTELDVPSPEQLRILEGAWNAQRDYNRLHPSPAWLDRERERLLAEKYATAQGRRKLEESRRLEADAAELLTAGERLRAIETLRDALRLQAEVNGSAASASVHDAERAGDLAARIAHLEAEPLALESQQLEAQAQAAAQAGNAALATSLLRDAAALQQRIDLEFAATGFADPVRLERLQAEMASIGAVELARERDLLIERARAAEAARALAEAATFYTRARDLQSRINTEFPQSAYASIERWKELEAARQTALNRPRVD